MSCDDLGLGLTDVGQDPLADLLELVNRRLNGVLQAPLLQSDIVRVDAVPGKLRSRPGVIGVSRACSVAGRQGTSAENASGPTGPICNIGTDFDGMHAPPRSERSSKA